MNIKSNLINNNEMKMFVRDTKSSDPNAWKQVWGNEARAINPLYDVNGKRNNLILEAAASGDWSKYNEFDAKQHPAWYDHIDGVPTKNKMYWASLVDSRFNILKEAQMSGDKEGLESWQRAFDEAVEGLKNAPGEMPYLVAFANNSDLAEKYGVDEPSDEWFNSKYNNPLVMSQGKFENNYWYDNAYFKENPDILSQVVTSVEQYMDSDAKEVAQNINKNANVAVDTPVTEEMTSTNATTNIASVTEEDSTKEDTLQQTFYEAMRANAERVQKSMQGYLMQQLKKSYL